MNWDRIEGDSKHIKGNVRQRRLEIDNAFNDQNDTSNKRHHLDQKEQAMQITKIDEADHELFDWQNMPKTRKHVRKPEHSINKMVKKSK